MSHQGASILPSIMGLLPYEWLTLAAITLGPVIAVLVSLWLEKRRKDREQKLITLRVLMTTRHLVGDPNYSAAINLIPVEFSGQPNVQTAYREFIEAAYADVTEDNRDKVIQRTAVKQTRLIFEIAKSMGYKIAETDIQTSAYAADGWISRDNLALDSQKAMRDIANTLLLQTRMAANATLEPVERTYLGLPEQDQ